jgi:DNA ligase (NAD+)
MKLSRIRELESEITRHKALYYQGNAEISDEAYDKLEADLKKIDPTNPVLQLVGSPVDNNTQKVAHQKKMLSLEKTYEVKDLVSFMQQGELVSVFKIDGSSCSLIYENGHLVMAKTRGDGSQGENITMKAAYISDIPKKLNTPLSVEIRGEIFCRSSAFHSIAEEMEKQKLEKPTSQRNIVAGLLGRKEHITFSRHLSFQAFDMIGGEEKTEEGKLKLLSGLGFDVPVWEKHSTEKSLGKRITEARDFMSEGDYLIDGLVFVLNDLKLHEELGETSHHPRYKIAFKFQGATKVAKISSITWQVSRSGRLTPVAEIEPTELSGATINRVTLHNMGIVKDFSLKAGDEIEIVRSGEVIPKFLSVAKSAKGEASFPKKCPSCDAKTEQEDIWLLCPNDACPGKKMETILHWIRQTNIEDLSEKRLQEMISSELVEDIPDLYKLTTKELMTLEKVKDKLAAKLFENIQKTKTLDLVVLLSALGVEGISTTKAEKIVAHGHNTVEKILALDMATLASIDGFAEKSATDIVRSIQSKKKLIKSLERVGLEITAPDIATGGVLEGKKICITGALSVPRADIEKIIKKNAGIVVGSVSKNTDYLLTNETDPSSSKYKKALEVGTKVITEEQFRKLVGV